jgi:hypothetical protein
LTVNGVTRQDSNTSNLIFDIPRIVSTLSAGVTLEVGDLVEARIERIGSLEKQGRFGRLISKRLFFPCSSFGAGKEGAVA